ncbi:hypothetical protein [Breznakiella homolactica]|uniref:Uncharacterized protein n=1 Tax=Breznakiella homolactica TaxID=2798577 RepID=A0A7T8B8T3_9SPIR|nr:hypothetical protein [Breznakiella homolactica]QQO07641.1 hypothetical protein JFL75_11855 [Breznakiella homolactica]
MEKQKSYALYNLFCILWIVSALIMCLLAVGNFIDQRYDIHFLIAALSCVVVAAGCGMLLKRQKKGLIFGFAGILIYILSFVTSDYFQRRLKANSNDTVMFVILCFVIPLVIGGILLFLAPRYLKNKE